MDPVKLSCLDRAIQTYENVITPNYREILETAKAFEAYVTGASDQKETDG